MSKPSKSGNDGNPPRKSSAPANDLSDWYAAQYKKAVGLDSVEGGARFASLRARFPEPHAPGPMAYPMTGRIRMSSFLSLKLRYPLGPDGYTCLASAAQLADADAHYMYVYWRRGQEDGDPEYICLSPTFDSRDGEYRRRFIRYPIFADTITRLADRLAPFEEAVLALVTGGLGLRSTVYPEEGADGAAATATRLRLPIVALAAALALDLWEYARGLHLAHTSQGYVRLIDEVAARHPELAKQSSAMHDLDLMALFVRGSHHVLAPQCGQKIVPMFLKEAMRFADYNLAAWRELEVSRLASDLVLNYISPAFSLYNQWAYVEGADATLFENPAMEERYVRGLVVEEAASSLRAARKRLGEGDLHSNYHTDELDARVYESVEYAQSFLLMSPVAIVHTLEDVGWALQSVGTYVRRAPTQWPAAVSSFATRDAAARHLFELAHGAHCLHTKLGVAHTDLHPNNMTLYMWGLADRQTVTPVPGQPSDVAYEPYYSDPVVAYVAGPRGESDTYIFPAAGDSACLIDFSRSILGPAFRPRLEEGRTAQYATNFYRDQVNRVMRVLHRYAGPYVEKHQEALKAAVLANYEAVFPVLAAVDFIAIGRSVTAVLEAEQKTVDAKGLREFKIDPAGIELARRLEKMAQELYITGLHDLVALAAPGAARATPLPFGAEGFARSSGASGAPRFPGDVLFERVFGDWLFPRWASREPKRLRSAQLVDAYNLNNPLRYSGTDYAKYPPWARLDEIERHLGEYKLTDLFERGVEPFLAALQPGARVEVIADELRRGQERLDGAPVATASSWFDE